MTQDKRVVYAFSIGLLAILLATLCLPVIGQRSIAAVLLPLAAVVALVCIKKRATPSIYRRQVLLIMAVSGLLYVILYYLTSFYFGAARSLARGWITVVEYILPITSILVSTEIVRSVLLAQKRRSVSVLCFLTCVLADILAFGDLNGILSFNLFMDFLGLTVFPAITGNLLYHALSASYGVLPNIAYRLPSCMYLYIFRYVPAMPTALLAFIRLIIPLLLLVWIDALYTKKMRYALKKKSRLSFIPTAIMLVLMIGSIMLISCQFRFGMLIIATESMTGELNKGDAVVYEQYDGDPIEIGEIIVFKQGNRQVVHRVVDIKRINSQTRYYTKGDTNEDIDTGYITEANIVGRCKFKIPYIGYPSIWVRKLIAFH